MPFSVKNEVRKIEVLLIYSEIKIEILQIVNEEYPEIFRRAILRVLEKQQQKRKDEK